jgi:hypothetical protein
MSGARRGFVWASFVLAAVVVAGVVVQIYLIAAWIFGESGALDAHKNIGAIVHPIEILVFVAGLVGWWGRWRYVAWSFALAVLGTLQVGFVGDLKDPGNGYLHGLHGGLALFVAGLAAGIAWREAGPLGLRARGEAPPPPATAEKARKPGAPCRGKNIENPGTAIAVRAPSAQRFAH